MHAEETGATFWEHVVSLRSHFLWAALFFLIATGIAFAFVTDPLIGLLLAPLHGETLVFLSPLGPFLFKMRVSFLAGLIVSVPAWLAILFHFAAPALPRQRFGIILAFIGAAALLAALATGATYFYLLPTSLAVLTKIAVPGTSLIITADSYLSFFFLELAVAVVVLEVPLVINALAYLRLVNPHRLGRQRRILYPILLTVLAVVTPTTDALTLAIVFVPAIVLAELGLAIAKHAYGDKPA